jgi:hypothetical protein
MGGGFCSATVSKFVYQLISKPGWVLATTCSGGLTPSVFYRYAHRNFRKLLEISDELVVGSGLDDHIIHVSFNVEV